MPKVNVEFRVEVPQERVFLFFGDVMNVGRCIAGVKAINPLPDGTAEWKVEIRSGMIAQTVTLIGGITEQNPPSSIRFGARGSNMDVQGEVTLAPDDTGTFCAITMELETRGPLKSVMDLVTGAIQKKMVEATVHNIQNALAQWQ